MDQNRPAPSRFVDLTSRVAEEIRSQMGRKRVTGRQLAIRLGVSDNWVSKRLRGIQPLDVNDLQRIADMLEVSVIDLFPGDIRRGLQ